MNNNELQFPDSNDGYDISLHFILTVRFNHIVIHFIGEKLDHADDICLKSSHGDLK